MYRSDGSSTVQIARDGEALPDGNGNFASFGGYGINNLGQVAFQSRFVNTVGAAANGIYRGDGTTLTKIARGGDPAPDGTGVLGSIDNLTINDSGQVGFSASVNAPGPTDAGEAVYRGSGGALTQIAREGQAAPDGNGVLVGGFSISAPLINESGQVAFFSALTGTSSGTTETGYFRGDGNTLVGVARVGQAAPDGDGALSFLGSARLSDSGHVVFSADLGGTSGGNADNSGLFRGDGATLTQIAREGQPAPGGNGLIGFPLNPSVNDFGQVAFISTLTGTSGGTTDDFAIYFYDGSSLSEVVRKGDSLLGSTITGFSFAFDTHLRGDDRSALNNAGQITYGATLADGRRVIAIATVPEPIALPLLALGGLALRRRRQR